MLITDKFGDYEYVSDSGIVYDILEGMTINNLHDRRSSDIIIIMLNDYENTSEYVGHIYGAAFIETLESDIKRVVDEFEEFNPDLVNKIVNNDIKRFLNDSEETFMEALRDAEAEIESPYEMEIEHCCNEDDIRLDGWYVFKYNKERGEAIPGSLILTDADAEMLNIDVIKCLRQYGCYYVA